MEVKIIDLRAMPEAENTFSGVGAIRYRLQGVLSTKQGLSAPLTIGSLMSRPVPGTGCRGDWEYVRIWKDLDLDLDWDSLRTALVDGLSNEVRCCWAVMYTLE